jgi:RNA polymerase sigma-70 factor, ECF subfamily
VAGETDIWAGRVAAVYREDRSRVLASLIRLLGDFELAEEALHDAFAAAVEQWPVRGMPDSPWRWLVSAGRFKAIDRVRRRTRADASRLELLRRLEAAAEEAEMDNEPLEDDTLRLVFTCCHPALPPDAQVALTLREVCGLTTEAIASAFLTGAPTVAQRIVRAKARIKELALPYEVPDRLDLPDRLEAVLRVIYLVFNEGYSSGATGPSPSLAGEAIRLGRLLAGLLPDAEALGLLALMLLQDSRRAARETENGDLVLLPDQDRTRWDRAKIDEAAGLVTRLLAGREIGAYTLQAAIAAEHAKAATESDTNWGRIADLYDLLMVAEPSPVVELNRAAAVAMRNGPAAGIHLMDAILDRGDLAGYHHAYAARAELHRRLGDTEAARADYLEALALARQDRERQFIERRLKELGGAGQAPGQ